MISPVLVLAKLLRERGVPVSTPEIIDSLSALALTPGFDAVTVKTVLQASLIKDKDFSRLFDDAFAEAFSASSTNGQPGEMVRDVLIRALTGADGAPVIEGEGYGRGSGGGRGGGTAGTGGDLSFGQGQTLPGRNRKQGSGSYKPGERTLMNLSFIAAGSKQKDEMLSLVRDLSRKMAVKKGVKKRAGGHRLHFGKLWRNSMGAGAFPSAWPGRRGALISRGCL